MWANRRGRYARSHEHRVYQPGRSARKSYFCAISLSWRHLSICETFLSCPAYSLRRLVVHPVLGGLVVRASLSPPPSGAVGIDVQRLVIFAKSYHVFWAYRVPLNWGLCLHPFRPPGPLHIPMVGGRQYLPEATGAWKIQQMLWTASSNKSWILV